MPPPCTAPKAPPSTARTSLAAGVGREFGYVAMSRARDRTVIHAVADDLPQAVEDLASTTSNPHSSNRSGGTIGPTLSRRLRHAQIEERDLGIGR